MECGSILIIALSFCLCAAVSASDEVDSREVGVEGESFAVNHYPAQGDSLILWVAPGYGGHRRMHPVARELAAAGVEVWHVDLSAGHFLPKSTATMRGLDGRYVAGPLEEARGRTDTRITLLSRSYGSLPVLRGARLWLIRQGDSGAEEAYIDGPIHWDSDEVVGRLEELMQGVQSL